MGEVPVFSCYQAKPLLAALGSVQTSLDLGRTWVDGEVVEAGLRVGEMFLSLEWVRKIAKEDRNVFRLDTDPPETVKVFSETTGWVRVLCPSATAPTVLVSGIPMHRIKNTDPVRDTATKIGALGKVRGKVLDTATGLGYTAIELAKTAEEVVTVELDPAALEVARLNPWSKELFSSKKIRQIIGDVFEEIRGLPSGHFEAVLHDPPTMALGGELYGAEFYGELRRVLRRGGRLFHYIGDPDSGLGKKQWPGVMRRLSEAGFANVERRPEAFGVLALAR